MELYLAKWSEEKSCKVEGTSVIMATTDFNMLFVA